MEIVLGMYRLRDPGGSEHYTLTCAEQLQRLGHAVTIFTEEAGAMAELVRGRGLLLATGEDELPAAADVVYAQESVTAYRLAARCPPGAVVTRDVPPRTLVMGVPAKAVRELPSNEG